MSEKERSWDDIDEPGLGKLFAYLSLFCLFGGVVTAVVGSFKISIVLLLIAIAEAVLSVRSEIVNRL